MFVSLFVLCSVFSGCEVCVCDICVCVWGAFLCLFIFHICVAFMCEFEICVFVCVCVCECVFVCEWYVCLCVVCVFVVSVFVCFVCV